MARYLLVFTQRVEDSYGGRTDSFEFVVECDPSDLPGRIQEWKDKIDSTLQQAKRDIDYEGSASVSLTQVLPL